MSLEVAPLARRTQECSTWNSCADSAGRILSVVLSAVKDLHAQSSAFEKSRKAGPDWEPAFSAHVNRPATSGHGPGVIGPPIASVPASGSQYCEPSSRVAMW